ncbi:hypothetical protein F4680DRAFT_465491 [Xylaria scruposa]|nr:hypothetical protein F4680DRAFT_465491 [Xylaria scruposa]
MNQPIPYGYRPIHDLPTPPRSSPPVTILDTSQKALQQQKQQQSPPTKPMSAPHRGLPLPAAMTLAQPPPPHGPPHPPAPGSVMQAQAPPAPSPHSQSLGPLPPPPQWQGSEDSMRSWLLAKAEEERRKQEEERTRQESLRLEQRRIEHDMLRTLLERGIPPPMIPVVFAGLSGGHLSQATLEWVQQFLPLPQHAQILPAQGPMSPGHRRDSQQYGSYAGSAGVPPTPGSVAGTQAGFVPYQGPGSPTRARAHTISGLGSAAGRPLGGLGSSALPRLSTGEGISGPPHPSHTATQQQPPPPPQQQPQQQQGAVAQQETQSPGIYFHYWQPPTSNVSASQQTASSVDSPKKRKATGPQQSVPPPGQRRSRSPTFGPQASSAVLSNPPPGRRRGHSRQRSDISAYRSTGRNQGESFRPHGGFSPGIGAPIVGTSRETTFAEPYQQPPRGSHSVSSMLSDQPPSARFPPDVRPPGQPLEGEQHSRASSEERGRGTHPPPPPPPPSAPRERTSD